MPRRTPSRAPPPHSRAFRQGSDDPPLRYFSSAEASPECEAQPFAVSSSLSQPEFDEDHTEGIDPRNLENDGPHDDRWDRRLRRRVNRWLPYAGTQFGDNHEAVTRETPVDTLLPRTRLKPYDNQFESSEDPGLTLDEDIRRMNREWGYDEAPMTETLQHISEAGANEPITTEPVPPRPVLPRLVQPESSRKASKEIFEINCSGCPKIIVGDHRYIKKHEATHGTDVECKAPGCKRRFPYPCRLERHMDRAHRKRGRYKCHECEICFHRSEDINKHLVGHGKVKLDEIGGQRVNVICSLCESESNVLMGFTWGTEARKHVVTQHPI